MTSFKAVWKYVYMLTGIRYVCVAGGRDLDGFHRDPFSF